MASNVFVAAVDQLHQLSALELDHHNKVMSRRLADSNWEMSVCLVASWRRHLGRHFKCSTLFEYCERCLKLSYQKASELLSAGQTMEKLPVIAEAFKNRQINWTKMRELKRVATPETEARWLAFAVEHTAGELQRRVALCPKEWKRNQQGEICEDELDEILGRPKLVRLTFYLTYDQYAHYEQAETRVRACSQETLSKEEVLMRLSEVELDRGSARQRSRYQVIVHKVENQEEGFYETRRGMLPVSPEVMARAISRGKSFPTEVIRLVMARAGNRCERCGRGGCRLDIHHLHRRSQGGTNDPELLQALCVACHQMEHWDDTS